MGKMFAGLILAGLLVALVLPPIRGFYFEAGMRWQYILIFSFLTAYVLSPLCAALALRVNVVDRPAGRKMHDQATPLFGGVAVYIALMGAMLLNGVFLPGTGVLLVAGSIIFFVGLYDDIRSLSPLFRLLVQVVAAVLVIVAGDIRLTVITAPGWWQLFNIPLTVLWFVGLTNALNFFDGIDGLAAGLSVIMSLFLGIIAFKTFQPALGWLAVAIAGSCLGFMPHNFIFGRSAKLFLGDAGSTFLGFMLAGLAVFGRWSTTSHFVSLAAPVLIFGVLIFDMAYISLSRLKNRRVKSIFKPLATPGQDHLHHRLLFMGFARKEAAFTIFIIAVCLGVSALIIMDGGLEDAALGLLQALLLLLVIVLLMWKGRDVPAKRSLKAGDRAKVYEKGTVRPLDVPSTQDKDGPGSMPQ